MFTFIRLAPVVLACAASWAVAQTPPPARPDPADPAASVPAAVWRGSLAGYRRYAEQPVAPWKQSNETVNRLGGWRAYAREAASAPAPGKRE